MDVGAAAVEVDERVGGNSDKERCQRGEDNEETHLVGLVEKRVLTVAVL